MRRGVAVRFRSRAMADVAAFAAADLAPPGPVADRSATLEVSPAMSPRDEAVFLLHTAAEVEHALMVQYLYAAWSLPADPGPVGRWRRAILAVAREEMAHFVAVQNLLRFVGGPLNLDREDFPFRTEFYPFPFRLDRLSRPSLARYVAAEMPARPGVDRELIAEVVRLAGGDSGDLPVNRVGALYNRLAELVGDPDRLPDEVFRPDTADLVQARPERFRADVGRGPLYLRTVRTRAEALALLDDVATQGEGELSTTRSHFLTFLDVFEGWPADGTASLDVPTNPTVLAREGADATGVITEPHARDWAGIFDHHYRMLLGWIQHALLTPAGGTAGGLALRAFDEMFVLSDIGPFLTTLPRAAGEAGRAGAPFQLPYTLALPDLAADRWAHHQDLVGTARTQVRALGPPVGAAEEEVRRRILAVLAAAEAFVAAASRSAGGPA